MKKSLSDFACFLLLADMAAWEQKDDEGRYIFAAWPEQRIATQVQRLEKLYFSH